MMKWGVYVGGTGSAPRLCGATSRRSGAVNIGLIIGAVVIFVIAIVVWVNLGSSKSPEELRPSADQLTVQLINTESGEIKKIAPSDVAGLACNDEIGLFKLPDGDKFVWFLYDPKKVMLPPDLKKKVEAANPGWKP